MLLIGLFILVIGRIFLVDENLFYLGLFCLVFCLEDVRVLQVKMQQQIWSITEYVQSKLGWLFGYLPMKQAVFSAKVAGWFQQGQVILWFYHVIIGWERKFFTGLKLVTMQKKYLIGYYAQSMGKLLYFRYCVDFPLGGVNLHYKTVKGVK